MQNAEKSTSVAADSVPARAGSGRRFLLCRPVHFDVTFEINPWMNRENRPDRERSFTEWEGLRQALEGCGAETFAVDSVEGLSDMVFPADIAVVRGGQFLRAKFRHEERRAEAAYGAAWLTANGFTELEPLADDETFLEGGDVLAFADALVAGHGFRTTRSAHEHMAAVFRSEVVSVQLRDPRLYHLDMSFCPLDSRTAIMAPSAWDEESRKRVLDLVPEPVIVSEEEAMSFSANSVVIGKTVVMSACSDGLAAALNDRGYTVVVSAINEFLKAGGGIRCMTLDLNLGSR